MDAKELRLGNYVTSFETGNVTVYGINEEIIHFYDTEGDICYMPKESFEAIPLVDEWFLQLGFDKGSDIMGDCYFIEDPIYDIDFPIHIDEYGTFYFYGLHIKIKYVHQLQNIFNIVTEQELILKQNDNTTDIPKP